MTSPLFAGPNLKRVAAMEFAALEVLRTDYPSIHKNRFQTLISKVSQVAAPKYPICPPTIAAPSASSTCSCTGTSRSTRTSRTTRSAKATGSART